jgi:hypothetical protein
MLTPLRLEWRHHTMQDTGASVIITIPSKGSCFVIGFLSIWLLGWAAGEVVGAIALIAPLVGIPGSWGTTALPTWLFCAFWLLMWTYGGISVIYFLLWQVAGKEVVEVSSRSFTICDKAPGIRREKEYLAEHVNNLRVSYIERTWGIFRSRGWREQSRVARHLSLWVFVDSYRVNGSGAIVFDYGASTIRFGSILGEAEARHIVSEILGRFPQYGAST